jgi:hypothetical protein
MFFRGRTQLQREKGDFLEHSEMLVLDPSRAGKVRR